MSAASERSAFRDVAVARLARILRAGGIVAYPTEGVFGIGCVATHERAVERILLIKGRSAKHGLIVLAADFEQLRGFVAPLTPTQRATLDATWPGPVTWVVPAALATPRWLTGGRSTVAVRVTAHPPARALCEAAGMPLVSTSANRHGRTPARDALAVRRAFGDALDGILAAPCGTLSGPTEIRDLQTGRVLRSAPDMARDGRQKSPNAGPSHGSSPRSAKETG